MTEQSTKIAYYIGDENTPYVIKVSFFSVEIKQKYIKFWNSL